MIVEQLAVQNKIPEEDYNNYLNVIFTIGGLKSAYSARKRYIKFNIFSTQDVKLMMDATGVLISKFLVHDKNFQLIENQ